ncbi:MAG: XrtA system polysaccharide deacetylase [Rhodospirillaceae bacterium]
MLDATPERSNGFTPAPVMLTHRDGRAVNAMSVDVEEHFQVQAMERTVKRADWDRRASRVEGSTNRILDLFAASGTRATFFTLGWVAERHPTLIRRIVAEGHELASHGYQHIRVDTQTPAEFRADVSRTKAILEDIGGVKVKGYRAATFSIGRKNLWAFDELAEAGYTYSSSINPIRHDLYGMSEAPRGPFLPSGSLGIKEFPITTLRLGERNLPCGGGGFFRLLPYWVSRWAISKVNAADAMPTIFYFHPWEIDPEQPREPGLPAKSRFRHYLNLGRMERRLTRLVQDFAWDRIDHVFAAK